MTTEQIFLNKTLRFAAIIVAQAAAYPYLSGYKWKFSIEFDPTLVGYFVIDVLIAWPLFDIGTELKNKQNRQKEIEQIKKDEDIANEFGRTG